LSKVRSDNSSAKSTQPSAGLIKGPVQAWSRFWFSPADPVALHAIRVAAGLLFICWLLPFAGQVESLFGLQGWFDIQAYRDASPGRISEDVIPQPIGWSILYLCGSDPVKLHVAYWLSLAVLALFTLGIGTRLTAVLTWVIVVSFTANPATGYDADFLLIILAFYLMIGYLLHGLKNKNQSLAALLLGSRENWLFGRSTNNDTSSRLPDIGANVALRLLQVHFAIVMLTSGLHKLQSAEWWSGAAFWYPLHPPLSTTLEQAREQSSDPTTYLTFLSLGAYATLVWQIAFPVFAWRPRWRLLLLGGAVIGWLGLAFMYELPLFGPAIFIGCLSYVTPAEWSRLGALMAMIPGLRMLGRRPVEAQGESTRVSVKKEESFMASRQR
jgi:hypothetical protein